MYGSQYFDFEFHLEDVLEAFGITDLTSENVNDEISMRNYTVTVLDDIVQNPKAFKSAVPHVISLGATITARTLRRCHADCLFILLDKISTFPPLELLLNHTGSWKDFGRVLVFIDMV